MPEQEKEKTSEDLLGMSTDIPSYQQDSSGAPKQKYEMRTQSARDAVAGGTKHLVHAIGRAIGGSMGGVVHNVVKHPILTTAVGIGLAGKKVLDTIKRRRDKKAEEKADALLAEKRAKMRQKQGMSMATLTK
jgi:hypothetical protein